MGRGVLGVDAVDDFDWIYGWLDKVKSCFLPMQEVFEKGVVGDVEVSDKGEWAIWYEGQVPIINLNRGNCTSFKQFKSDIIPIDKGVGSRLLIGLDISQKLPILSKDQYNTINPFYLFDQ
jgi:hypothetical protein